MPGCVRFFELWWCLSIKADWALGVADAHAEEPTEKACRWVDHSDFRARSFADAEHSIEWVRGMQGLGCKLNSWFVAG